jgi:Ca-activated chloride channel family protein
LILEKINILPYLITIFIIAICLFAYGLKNINAVIEKYWVCKKTKFSILANIIFVIALATLSFALLDPKGNEEKVESSISDQKTIILIDSSLSMLVEDVRPNRFERALLLARHFIQRASGHQISVVLFSDLQKKIIPFTSDIDFLDAKLAGMDRRNVSAGGSNLSQAIAESARYFIDNSKDGQMRGNILVFSDFEEHEQFPLSLSKTVAVAAVGLGTAQGGPIPIRTQDGIFKGNKTFDGKEVVSKLGESGLAILSKEIPTFRQWIALSYSMPSEEIISFFRETYLDSLKTGLVSTRPTLAKPIVAIGMLLLLLALIFRMMPAFTPLLVLISFNLSASEFDNYAKMNKRERFKVSEELMVKGEMEKAALLYEENNALKATIEDKINYLSTKINGENGGWAITELSQLYNDKSTPDQMKNIIRNNLLAAGKSEDKKEQDKNKNDKQEENQENEKNENEDKKDQKQDKGDKQKSKNQKQSKQKDDDSGKPENKDEKNGESEPEKSEPKEADSRQQLKEHEEKQSRERKMVKLPAILKQLADDDANLQRKYTDTATTDQENQDEKKDW